MPPFDWRNMCKNAYEAISNITKKSMIYCRLNDEEQDEMLKLCCKIRFCDEKDKYIFHNEKECKRYE